MVAYEEETAPALSRVVDARYKLSRMIGRGAMGAVYEAEDLTDGRAVALKIVHAHLSKNEVNAARFAREARVTQHLDHPGIVRTYAAGTDADGSLFLVMELLEGETLRDRMESGRYTSHHALWIITEVLRALAVAHHAGVVHRDLKPENVFLARADGGREVVKLLDFGIARELESVSVTRTETTVGTPSYMAPEQATSAKTVGPGADVWAIGVILYRLLTGRLPFVGDGPYDVVLRVCAMPHVPVLEIEPTADPALAALVEACLIKDPRGRPADADALLGLLEPLVSRPRGLSTLERHPTPPRPDRAVSDRAIEDRPVSPPPLSAPLLAEDLVIPPAPAPRGPTTPSVEALFASDALSREITRGRRRSAWPYALSAVALVGAALMWGVVDRAAVPPESLDVVVSREVEAVPDPVELAPVASDAPLAAPSVPDGGAVRAPPSIVEAPSPTPSRPRRRRLASTDDAPGNAAPEPEPEIEPDIDPDLAPAPSAAPKIALPPPSPQFDLAPSVPPQPSIAASPSPSAPATPLASPAAPSPEPDDAPSPTPTPRKRKAPPFVGF